MDCMVDLLELSTALLDEVDAPYPLICEAYFEAVGIHTLVDGDELYNSVRTVL
jgi:hypothetical protein